MANVLRVAIVDPSDSSRESLKSILLGLDSIWLEAECSRYEFFLDVVQQTHPDIAMVSLDPKPEKALDLVAKLSVAAPECSIFVLSNITDGSVILRAMRAGAKEFLTLPLRVDDLAEALERLDERRFGKGRAKARGSAVICVAAATGGVGCTSSAVNTAAPGRKTPNARWPWST